MMGMLGNFLAGAGGAAADYTMKSGLQAQLQEAEMAKMQRIEEMRQNFKIADEDRSRANDLKAGQDIESTAKGMIAANAPPKPGVATDGTLTVDGAGLDPNPKPSRRTVKEAERDAAEKLGYTKRASELGQALDTERRWTADENKDARSNKRDDNQDAFQRDQLTETSRHNKASEDNRAEQIMHQYETGALKMQLAAATAESKLPKQIELSMKARLDAVEKVFSDSTMDEAGRKAKVLEINKTFGPQLVKQVDVNEKTGQTVVKSWDGRVETHPTLDAARESFGLTMPKDKVTPPAQSSPIKDALSNLGNMVGGSKSPDYTPPTDSPAAKMIAGRDATTSAKSKSDKAAMDDAFNAAESLVTKALQSNDPRDAQSAQDSPGFKYLPQSYQSKIYKLVNGR